MNFYWKNRHFRENFDWHTIPSVWRSGFCTHINTKLYYFRKLMCQTFVCHSNSLCNALKRWIYTECSFANFMIKNQLTNVNWIIHNNSIYWTSSFRKKYFGIVSGYQRNMKRSFSTVHCQIGSRVGKYLFQIILLFEYNDKDSFWCEIWLTSTWIQIQVILLVPTWNLGSFFFPVTLIVWRHLNDIDTSTHSSK